MLLTRVLLIFISVTMLPYRLLKIKKGNKFGKNVKVMTLFDDVTISLAKFKCKHHIALAPSFNFI